MIGHMKKKALVRTEHSRRIDYKLIKMRWEKKKKKSYKHVSTRRANKLLLIS